MMTTTTMTMTTTTMMVLLNQVTVSFMQHYNDYTTIVTKASFLITKLPLRTECLSINNKQFEEH
jgi:hypothetical protein